MYTLYIHILTFSKKSPSALHSVPFPVKCTGRCVCLEQLTSMRRVMCLIACAGWCAVCHALCGMSWMPSVSTQSGALCGVHQAVCCIARMEHCTQQPVSSDTPCVVTAHAWVCQVARRAMRQTICTEWLVLGGLLLIADKYVRWCGNDSAGRL